MKKYWHKLEVAIDRLIPFCLVLLLFIIIIELFYKDVAHHYHIWIILGDAIIVTIFVIDLVFKYLRMRNVPLFLRRYWLDILAVFPFYLLFRVVEFALYIMPISESLQSFQMMLHEGLEIEKEGSKIVKEAGKTSRFTRFARFIRPVVRLPRFLKIATFFEKPTGRHHHYESQQSIKIMEKNKTRAASPLVATAILFFLALLLGILIVNFSSYIEDSSDICQDIYEIKLVSLGNKPRICQEQTNISSPYINFLMENNAEKPVFGLHMTFIGDSENPTHIIRDYNVTILPYGTSSSKYHFPGTIGTLQQFKLSVYRKLGADLVLCSKTAVAINDIPQCSSS